jgi:putative FmdB family regulatory protein
MPIYSFRCEEHGEFEELVPYNTEEIDCPTCKVKAGKVFKAEVALHIPAYMRADGSKGSSARSTARQAKYLKSERHKEAMKQAEKYEERMIKAEKSIQNMKEDLTKEIRKKLDDRK